MPLKGEEMTHHFSFHFSCDLQVLKILTSNIFFLDFFTILRKILPAKGLIIKIDHSYSDSIIRFYYPPIQKLSCTSIRG